MTAWSRLFVTVSALLGATMTLGIAVPATAQNNEAPVDITAAPPPSADSVGPAQLRNFSLGGPSVRPSTPANNAQPATARPAATTTPQATTPVQREASPAATSSNADRNVRQVSAERTAEPTGEALPTTGRDSELTLPQRSAEVAPAQEPTTGPSVTTIIPTVSNAPTLSLMPWIAALLAAVAGGALLWWMRHQRLGRYNDPGRLAFAGPQPEADVAPPPRTPAPRPAPRPDPIPPSAPLSDDGMIVSRSLRPMLRFDFQPDRLLINDKEVAIQFDMVLANEGGAPARDVLVEAVLVTAHAAQDQQIAQFFRQPEGEGDRIAAIAPLSKVSLKSIIRLPIDEVRRFTVEGRELFVPLVAVNVRSRSASGDTTNSASFMIGRGTTDDSKLAPFLVEKGPKIISGLSARHHSNGLNQ